MSVVVLVHWTPASCRYICLQNILANYHMFKNVYAFIAMEFASDN